MVEPAPYLQKLRILRRFTPAALVLLLLLVQLLFTANAPWVGDYWEHRAVLDELINNPGNPSHPLLLSDKPHAFFSPYLVALGWAGSYTHLTAAQLLGIAAVLNLLLFLVSIRLLAGLLLPSGNRQLQFAALLVAVLCCWGYDPPNFSSFYHLGTFFYTTPYPSTFSFVLSVPAAACVRYLLYHSLSFPIRLFLAGLVIFLLTTILLTHPLTFLFAVSLLVAVAVQAVRDQTTSLFRITVSALGFIILTFALASFWPYYPFYELLTYVEAGNRFHTDSRELYSSLYFKLLPLAVLVLFTVPKPFRFINNHLPVLLALLFLALLFFYGFFSGSFGFGRMIAFMALLSQVLLVTLLLKEQSVSRKRIVAGWLILTCLPFAVTSIPQVLRSATTTHSRYLARPVHQPFELTDPSELAHRLLFLEKQVPKGALVFCDTTCARYLPGLGMRVVATGTPLYWIPDYEQRLKDAWLFFYSGTPSERDSLLQKYQPDYLLLTPATRHLLPQINRWTSKERVHEENGLVLVPLKFSAPGQTND